MIKKNYGKILGSIIVIGIALMVLTGCASQSSQANPVETVTQFEQPTLSPEQQYISHIRSLGNMYVDNSSDSSLVELGKQACTVLDTGYTVEELVTGLINSGSLNTAEQYEFAGIVVGGGVRYFCPEYITEVEAYLANN